MTRLPDLTTHDGRRAWAFLAILGGCVVMTLFAAVGVWLVASDAKLSFWLAMAAHAQILVGLTAFGWVLGRRMQAQAGKDGVRISDHDDGKGGAA